MFCCDGSSFLRDVGIIFEMATHPCVQCYDIHTQLDRSHGFMFVLKQIYIMQRSKNFCTFHLVHSSAISQSLAPQKFHDVGIDPKALPILAYLLESIQLYVFWGGSGGGNKTSRHVTFENKIRKQMSKVEAFVCFGALAKKFIMGFNFLQPQLS